VLSRAGARELRIDGTFASFYEPGRATTGSVWDALAAALLALPPGRRSRVLLLGLGGGSAARVVRAVAPRARILGVEIDPQVVRLARRHFDLDALDVEVSVADAREFLRGTRRRFDAVLEDVFVGRGRDIVKPEGLPEPGLRHAARLIAPGGVLASNTLDETSAVRATLRELFPGQLEIGVEGYDNRILVGGPAALSARMLRSRLAASSVLSETLPNLSLRTIHRVRRR
jgi:spermidine synthase